MSEEELSVDAFFDALSSAGNGYDTSDFGGRMARYQDFRAVFGTEQGLRVLHEILRQCGVNKSPVRPGPVDPYRVMFESGRQSVGQTVMGLMHDRPAELPTRANHNKE